MASLSKILSGCSTYFHCLKSLNDLVRLAKALDVDFPFSAYAAIEHIPVIEVEFVHLAGLESYPGQLTLLDTPGQMKPGNRICKMLNQQLARASAVLAVLDYTQLKSISDEEVREAILAVGQPVPLYVLVNKFDQQDRNSDDADRAGTDFRDADERLYYATADISGVVDVGLPANRARNELANSGKLPAPEQQRWVEDFAHAALGRRWRHADRRTSNIFVMLPISCGKIRCSPSQFRRCFMPLTLTPRCMLCDPPRINLLNYAQQAREYWIFVRTG